MKYSLLKHKVTGARAVRNNTTGEQVYENENPSGYRKRRQKAVSNSNAAVRADAMRSLGLVRCPDGRWE